MKHFNGTLINMLGTLPGKPKSTWREQVPTLVHAYNCTRNSATDLVLIISCLGGNHAYQLTYFLVQILVIYKVTLVLNML